MGKRKDIKKLRDIIISRLNDDGVASFDPWSGIDSAYVFQSLKRLDVISIDGKFYKVSKRAGGGVGMGEYPESVTLKRIDKVLAL